MRIAYALFCATVLAVCASAQQVVYVDGAALSGGAGSATSPFTTIAAAITAASSGDEIRVAPGVYAEIVDYQGKSLRIIASQGTSTTTLMPPSGQDGPALACSNGEASGTAIEGFRITGGDGTPALGVGGGVEVMGTSSLLIRDCLIENNVAEVGRAGGVQIDTSGSVEILASTLRGNQSLDGGVGEAAAPGACYVVQGTVTVEGTLFEANSGGAAQEELLPAVDQNPRAGAGALVMVSGDLSVRRCVFESNLSGQTLEFPLGNGRMTGASGAIDILSGNALFEGCEFLRNRSRSAVQAWNTFLPGGAGALAIHGGSSDLRGCTFDSNVAHDVFPEAIAIAGPGAVFIGRSQNTFASICDSLFVGNQAGAGSGGWFGDGAGAIKSLQLYPQAMFSGLTVIANESKGFAWNFAGAVVQGNILLRNSVVWANEGLLGGVLQAVGISGPLPEYSTLDVGPMGPGSIAADPLFVDAAQGDYRLSPNSPCINAGDSPQVTTSFDLLGNPRIYYDDVDMGCYEYVDACSLGTAQAGPLLRIAGDDSLVVELPLGSAATITLAQPATNPFPANFVLWGRLGMPVLGDVFVNPQLALCFQPAHLNPTDPTLFVLANSFAPDALAFLPQPGPAPFAYTTPTVPVPAEFTLQALVVDQAGASNTIASTNAVTLRVQ